MYAREIILKLTAELAHLLLGYLEVRPYFFGKDQSGYEDQRERCAGNERKFCIDGKKHDEHAQESHDIGYALGDHMCIEEFEITGIIDDPAHQVAGLLIMKIPQMHALKLVIGLCPKITDQVPGSFVSKVVTQESEKDA